MAVEIREITPTKAIWKKYTKFGIDLYRINDYYVPPLIMDDVETLSTDKNPAFDYCKAKSWMA